MVELQGFGRVRLLGVGSPRNQTNGEAAWKQADEYCRRLLMGQTVRLETDLQKVNNKRERLVHLYKDDETFVNVELVRLVFAVLANEGPDSPEQVHRSSGRRTSKPPWHLGRGTGDGSAFSSTCLLPFPVTHPPRKQHVRPDAQRPGIRLESPSRQAQTQAVRVFQPVRGEPKDFC